MGLMDKIRERARGLERRVVLPEGEDARVLEAAVRLREQGLARPILLGHAERVEIPLSAGVDFVDLDSLDLEPYAEAYASHRGRVTAARARRLVQRRLFFGALMVGLGEADAMVAGASCSSARVISAAALALGYAEGVRSASSFFLMDWAEGSLVYADAAVAVDPAAEELAGIAVLTACNAGVLLEIEPRVALVAGASRGDAEPSPFAGKIEEAVARARRLAPGLAIDGPLRVAVALAPGGAAAVLPDSPLREPANVIVFPHLDAANPAYKLGQYLAGARAIGPIMQGFSGPVCDLSRGASVQDIVDVATIAAVKC